MILRFLTSNRLAFILSMVIIYGSKSTVIKLKILSISVIIFLLVSNMFCTTFIADVSVSYYDKIKFLCDNKNNYRIVKHFKVLL